MASIVKDKKIFNFGGFRGMDTENKPDKVERFRAISGKNFYIDSNTLKTRPALVNNKKYNLGGNILGSYFFNGTEIIFTDTNRIYFLRGDESFFTDGLAKNADRKVFTNVTSFSFNSEYNNGISARPFFVQEKECLFVFCVGDIYVISLVDKEDGIHNAFVVYPIDSKIIYEGTFTNYCSETNYGNLPYSYIPTIQIGDKQFEDVNLLSNKRKYKLFSKPAVGDEEYTTYDLLGDYQSSKNGAFKDIGVSINFYGQNLNSLNQIPIFEGVQNETAVDYENDASYKVFPSISGDSGEEPDLSLLKLDETILATDIWEFGTRADDDTEPDFDKIISENVGLTKEKALMLKLPNGQTIFEYLRDFNLAGYETEIGAKIPIYTIKVDVEYMYRVKNSSGVIISAGKKGIAERKLYFSIKTFAEIVAFNYETLEKGIVDFDDDNTDVFPSQYIFPDVATTKLYSSNNTYSNLTALNALSTKDVNTEYKTIDGKIYHWSEEGSQFYQIDGFMYPTILTSSNGEISKQQVEDVLRWFKANNTNTFADDIGEAQVNVRFTDYVEVSPASSSVPAENITLPSISSPDYAYSGNILGYNIPSSPSYPTLNFDNPNNYPVIGLTHSETFFATNEDNNDNYNRYCYIGSNNSSISSRLKTKIQNYVSTNNLSAGHYIFKIRMIEYVKDIHTKKYKLYGTYTLVVRICVSVTPAVYWYRHYGYTLQFVKYSEKLNPLYELKENDGFISLKLSNVLINYKNEPAIDIELTFQKNSYNKALIAKNRFGVSFGSEYRVFLAGNPDFKHIDRYNISNDLLGNNVKNQSYELSYFPSKQYRVVGGSASAINGYVVANDTQLYVTKTQAINDSCLFIRTRTMDDNGNVSYFEYKTNIMKSPINERCITNFYNDIVMLTKDGLLGVEISSNVLTNERLLKLRSGFINKELSTAVKNASSVWCVDDSERLYMFIDNLVYVADARYISANENAQISNVSYEIVKWELDKTLNLGFLKDGSLIFYDEERSYIFEEDAGKDETINVFSAGELAFTSDDAIITANIFNELQNEDKITFTRKNILDTNKIILGKVFDTSEIILTDGNWIITQDILDTFAKRTGEYMNDLKFYIYSDGTYTAFTSSIAVGTQVPLSADDEIFVNIYGKPLYITKTATTGHIKLQISLRDAEFFTVIGFSNCDFSDFDYFYNASKAIKLEWYSGVLDFGDKLYEKTMFEITFYARRLKSGNLLKYGYRTMRGYKEASNDVEVDISNSISFDENNFNIFAVSTFDNVAITRKQKENNFLYLQFIFKCEGSVEISDIIVYYKNNRKTKSVS